MWTFIGTAFEGQAFTIEGVNVFASEWRRVPGEHASVRDPMYGQAFECGVYSMMVDGRTIEFAAGELSNCVYGFYRRS